MAGPNTHINVAGVWKRVNKVHVNITGTWKEVNNAYINVSGTWKKFHASGYTPTTVTYNGTQTGTETVPAGATSCRIRVWGGGGGGGKRDGGAAGYGGSSGAFSEKTVAVSAGDQINYVCGDGGAAFTTNLTAGSGGAGGLSRVGNITATGGFAGTSMLANGGGGGNALTAGTVPTASGGTTNTSGNAGNNTEGAVGGGTAPGTGGGSGGLNVLMSYDTETMDWSVITYPTSGSTPGGGGGAGSYSTAGNDFDMASEGGGLGRVEFYYT